MERARAATFVLYSFFSILLLWTAVSPAYAEIFPGSSWTVLPPQNVGLDSGKLNELKNQVQGSGMIVRYGYQAYSWGSVSDLQNWASASKPVLATFLMLAVVEGKCTYQSTMSQYHSGGTTKDRSIKFIHLANQLSGYSRGENPAVAWAYNDYAMNLFGYTLFHKVFGGTPSSVFDDKFSFFQFQDNPMISDSQYGRLVGVSIRDFARLGLFWLEHGKWGNVQHIPAYYFNVLDTPVSPAQPLSTQDGPESWNFGTFGGGDNDTDDGPGEYSFCFWVNTHGFIPGVPSDVFIASGHGGAKICAIIPSLDLVAVGAGGMWNHPPTEAIQLLMEAAGAATAAGEDTQLSTWGRLKDRYR